MNVTAVVPNWNGAAYLPQMLASFEGQRFHRVLIVDNGSSDGSDKRAEEWGAEVIRLGSNRGFAVAVNVGIERCGPGAVAIINNDVELAPNWLATLTAALDSAPEAWFATGKILSGRVPGMIDGTFDVTSRAACSWRCGAGRPDAEIWDQPRAIAGSSMTAALFRRELFSRVGVLDETFESYLEDVDFGLRCALESLPGLYAPNALATHWGSGTLGVWHPETVRRIARNQLFLIAKHYPPNWGLRLGWPVLAGQLLWGALAFQNRTAWAWLRGKFAGLRAYPHLRTSSSSNARIELVLRAQEQLMRDMQLRCGFDTYWKVYFALVS